MRSAGFVEFKIFMDGHRDFTKVRLKPQAGRFTKLDIEAAKEKVMNGLMEQFPLRKFTAIPTAFNRFNIVHEVGEA
jgi:hypothetical protein